MAKVFGFQTGIKGSMAFFFIGLGLLFYGFITIWMQLLYISDYPTYFAWDNWEMWTWITVHFIITILGFYMFMAGLKGRKKGRR